MDLHKAALLAHTEGLTAACNQTAALHMQVKLVCMSAEAVSWSQNILVLLNCQWPGTQPESLAQALL